MKTSANSKRRGFTLIEMVGVLAVIAILAALLVPKIFAAINEARLNNAVSSFNTAKSATMQYYAKYGKFGATNGVTMTNGSTFALNWDSLVLLPEGLIEKPFGPRIGSSAFVEVVAPLAGPVTGTGTGNDVGAYNLDGIGVPATETANGTMVVEAVIKGIPIADAVEISRRIDGDAFSPGVTNSAAADTSGRVKYAAPSAGATDVYIYIAHK